jgi:hypothetical protein
VLLTGNIQAPGAAYHWYCVAPGGKATPIVMTAACQYQYPGQKTSAFTADANNAYAWVCIAPASGRLVRGPGYLSWTSSVGTLTVQDQSGVLQIAFDGAGGTSSGVLVVNANGSGYLSFEGAGSGSSGVVTFDGAGSGSSG